jgi:hypothetical protein
MTYWGQCSFKDSHLGYPWHDRYEIGRGLCAFSNRFYDIGDLVLVEKPLIKCSGHHPFTDNQLEEIKYNLNTLSDSERIAFYNMANSVPPSSDNSSSSKFDALVYEAANIFITNSFDMTDSPSGDACAIYCAIGRLNHSCYPNVQVSHDKHYYFYLKQNNATI